MTPIEILLNGLSQSIAAAASSLSAAPQNSEAVQSALSALETASSLHFELASKLAPLTDCENSPAPHLAAPLHKPHPQA